MLQSVGWQPREDAKHMQNHPNESMTGSSAACVRLASSSIPLSNRRPATAVTERHVVAFVAHRSLAGKCVASVHMKIKIVQMTGQWQSSLISHLRHTVHPARHKPNLA